MRDSKRLINTLVGIFVIIGTVAIIIVSINNYQKNNPPIIEYPGPKDSEQEGDGDNNNNLEPTHNFLPEAIVPDSNIKNVGEPVRQRSELSESDFTITVKNVTKVKSLDYVGLSEDDFGLAPYGIKEDGVYKYDTFVFLDLTIKNNLSSPYQGYISYFLIINSKNDEHGSEPMYKDVIHTTESKAYWFTKFAPYEELNIRYGYQVADISVESKDLLLKLSNFGAFNPDSDDDQYYIAVNGKG